MKKGKKGKVCLLAAFFWPVSGDVEDYPYNIASILKETKQDFFARIQKKCDQFPNMDCNHDSHRAEITVFLKQKHHA